MRNISVKIPWAENIESDLEEGEIPEFEVPSSIPDREGKLLGSQKVQSLNLLNPNEPVKKRKKTRFSSPPSEGEYLSEEEKLASSGNILQKDTYQNSVMGKAPINMHPFQVAYGSVEDIMTKIDESLGRDSSYYYKERRTIDYRYLYTAKDSRDANALLRETSPILKRYDYNYYNRRRSSETEPVSNIREKYGKPKSKKLSDGGRAGQIVAKRKRKRGRSQIHESGMNKPDTSKKRVLEEKERECPECKKSKKQGLNNRLFKVIPVPQEKGSGEEAVKEIIEIEDSNSVPDIPVHSSANKIANYEINSPTVNVWDNCLAKKKSPEKCEQLNDEENDDELELIKLRLLALTSNKKSSQALSNDCYLDSLKDLEIYSEENITNGRKCELDNDLKNEENPPLVGDQIGKEHPGENDIDRYELFLRAEALKTALLKKHHRIIQKRKSFNSIFHGDPINEIDDVDENILDKSKGTDADKEPLQKSQEKDIYVQLAITENNKKLEMLKSNKLGSENDKNELASELCQEIGPHSEHPVTMNIGSVEKNSFVTESSILEKALNSMNSNGENYPTEHQSGKKKAKKIRPKRIKQSVDLKDLNIKKNSLICEKKEDICQSTKSEYSSGLNVEDKTELGKKFMSTVPLPLSNCNVTNISNNQLPLDKKRSPASTITEKTNALGTEELVPKIPDNERIIVHLGSESSDEEGVPECNLEKSNTTIEVQSVDIKPLMPVDNQNKIEEFEKSVELLLRGARRKIEKKTEINSGIPSTPEAVYSHLAPSQRLEYIRLKQKIAEREKLRKAEISSSTVRATDKSEIKVNPNEVKTNGQENGQKNIGKSYCPLPKEAKKPYETYYPKSIPNYGVLGNSNSARAIVNKVTYIRNPATGINSKRLPLNTPRKDCTDFNSKNIKKGLSAEKSILERKRMITQNKLHLERLKTLWKNIKIEKLMEAKYEKEIKKLKAQQNFFEQKINLQKLKIKKLADESKQIYEAFQKNKKRVEMCSKKRKVLIKPEKVAEIQARGKEKDFKGKIAGKDVKEEFIAHRLENDARLKAKDTEGGVTEKRKIIKMNVEKKNENENDSDVKEVIALMDKEEVMEYNSPLQALAKRSESLDCPRVDPNIIMCQYDLLGKCNDEECIYQHWRA